MTETEQSRSQLDAPSQHIQIAPASGQYAASVAQKCAPFQRRLDKETTESLFDPILKLFGWVS